MGAPVPLLLWAVSCDDAEPLLPEFGLCQCLQRRGDGCLGLAEPRGCPTPPAALTLSCCQARHRLRPMKTPWAEGAFSEINASEFRRR